MKIYITGISFDASDEERQRCQQAVQELIAAGLSMREIINPASIKFAEGTSWKERKNLRVDLINSSTGIYVLRGWGQSIDARHEVLEAFKMDRRAYWQESNDIAEIRKERQCSCIGRLIG